MSGWITLLLILTIVILYLFVLFRNYQSREQASNDRLAAHLTLLNSGLGEVAKEDADASSNNNQLFVINLKKLWGFPPDKAKVIEEVFQGEEVADGWDYAIHIHEAAEHYLGTDLFLNLEDRVASIPGIDKCLHEDREVFLICAKIYPAEILIELFWREFVHTAEIAHIKTGM